MIAVAPPNYETLLQWDIELVDRAVRYWKISESALPPSMDDILFRDMTWDDACYEYRYAIDFYEDNTKRKDAGLI